MGESPEPDGPGTIREPDQPWNQKDFFEALLRHAQLDRPLKGAMVLEMDIAKLLDPMIEASDPQTPALLDEVQKIFLAHDRKEIDHAEYLDRLRAFKLKLMNVE